MKPILPKEALDQHVAVLGKTRSGKSSVMRGLVEGLLEAQQPVGIIDPKGDWWGIKSSADGKSAGYPVVIFGGSHADVPINAHAGAHIAELVATGNRPYLIDLGGWMVGDRSRFFVDFASTLFRLTAGMRWLVIDEAHNFAPQGKVLDPLAGQMLHWANRLASEGLGKGLQLLAASQRPQKLHKDFLTSCETLIAMKVIHPLDRGAIKDWIDGCPDAEKGREVMLSLASMPRGTGWVWSPEIDFGPKKVAFPMFKTYDSFKPRANDAPAKLKGWAAVDLEAVKAKLATVVEEAQANDPVALRRRILELEKAKPAKVLAIDHDAVRAAEQRGYERGRAEANEQLERAAGAVSGINSRIAKALSEIQSASVQLASQQLRLYPRPDAPQSAKQAQIIPKQVRSETIPDRSSNSTLPKAERLILTALAQYPQGRSKVQVAVLTGYAKNGGSFNNSLGALRSAGRIEGRGENLTITPAGTAALGHYQPLPTGRALLEHWQRQLGKAERAILGALARRHDDAGPTRDAMSKTEIAERAGYEPTGGSFNNALGRLRTLELIAGRGEIRLSDNLI